MSVDPLSEKYAYNSTYAFQENKMGMGRELEGLEAQLINENTVVWKVKINDTMKNGNVDNTTLLEQAGKILSQNGLNVTIIEDKDATFTVNLQVGEYITETAPNGEVTIKLRAGYTIGDNDTFSGNTFSTDNPQVLAHEFGHKAGLKHIWEEGSCVENNEDNKNNLENSVENNKEELRNSEGTELNQDQTDKMKETINNNYEKNTVNPTN